MTIVGGEEVEDRLISLKAAIDILDKWLAVEGYSEGEINVMRAMKTELEALPSVYPEPSQVARDIATIIENEQDMRVMLAKPELIRCKDCKYYTIERGWNGIEFTVCSISPKHHHPIRRENDYCSHAERKEGETDD